MVDRSEIESIFLDELDCPVEDLPEYLCKLLVNEDVTDDRKYSAIEAFQTKVKASREFAPDEVDFNSAHYDRDETE